MTTWFTSDEHYGHKNIIRFQSRPFNNVEEMDETIILNHNKIVQPDDIVFHLGDFSFHEKSHSQKIFKRLLGHKFLILGNHDKRKRVPTGWAAVDSYRELELDGKFIVLFHYGMRVWNRSFHGSYHLYGHSHGHLPGTTQSQDVGVDCWNFTPVKFEDLLKRMSTNKSFIEDKS